MSRVVQNRSFQSAKNDLEDFVPDARKALFMTDEFFHFLGQFPNLLIVGREFFNQLDQLFLASDEWSEPA